MTISPEGIEITNRFFQAIEILRKDKKMRGLQTFTRAHKFNRWNMQSVRAEPESSFLKTEWIYWLAKDYNVNLYWLIYGTGDFYAKPQQ